MLKQRRSDTGRLARLVSELCRLAAMLKQRRSDTGRLARQVSELCRLAADLQSRVRLNRVL
jgi:hypothetical protein